jgi:hypothetical protein
MGLSCNGALRDFGYELRGISRRGKGRRATPYRVALRAGKPTENPDTQDYLTPKEKGIDFSKTLNLAPGAGRYKPCVAFV